MLYLSNWQQKKCAMQLQLISLIEMSKFSYKRNICTHNGERVFILYKMMNLNVHIQLGQIQFGYPNVPS